MVPEAMEMLERAIEENGEKITAVVIAGPGDPLATPEITLQAITLVRQRYPALRIGLKTIGLGSEGSAGDMARAGLNFVEMQVDGIKAEVLEKIYAWIRPSLKTLKISKAVELLIREQRNGVSALNFHNIKVTILTTLYPGLNIDHVPRISAAMLVVGACDMALLPYSPEPGAEVALERPNTKDVLLAMEKVRAALPIVQPLVFEDCAGDAGNGNTLSSLPGPNGERRNVAVASSNGIEVDIHLGQAIQFLIYGPRADGLTCLLATRDAPVPGMGSTRWNELAAILHDCFVVLAAGAGETPRRILADNGIKVLLTEDNIAGTVDVLYGGGKKNKKGMNGGPW
jgi:nitrogen fixation protein NifB